MFSPRLPILLFCLVSLIAYLRKKKAQRRRLPPGPPAIPLLGNIFGIDAGHPWKTYAKWGHKYGDIIYTRLLTQDIIVINSDKIAKDLLDKRSQVYSSRPAGLHLVTQIFGTDFLSFFLPYGDRWRLHRRLFHQAFHPSAAPSFRHTQLRKTHDLISSLASTPSDYPKHLQLLAASTMLSIVYDYEASSMDDPLVTNVERALGIGTKEFRPEVTSVLIAFPFLKHLPEWFPGAGFKRRARTMRESFPGWVDGPFDYVKKCMAAGTGSPSMVSDALMRIRDGTYTEAEATHLENDVKEACATVYCAAVETTHSTLWIFVLVMALYPDVQARAQAEIDSVIGEGLARLPNWDDRPSLPYVEAVIKEMLRWYPAVPLGIPHATVDDDTYEGYYIPKGAIVIYNAWAISRDPVKFPDPEKFKPERFLKESSNLGTIDELAFTFGYGRRVCVGRHIADASLWIVIVSLLSVFRFEAPPSWDLGPDGTNVKWTEGVVTHPTNIPFVIKPRHENVGPNELSRLIALARL